ncbi:CvpA family protein [bacterium]|nr:MAG: CvpA family protein [bacterium]
METLDIIVLVPIAYFAYKGFQSGIVKEVLSIVGMVLAVFLTINYLDETVQLAKTTFNLQQDFNPFIWGILLFVVVLIATNLITWLIGKVLSAANLSAINKLLGLAFGALKASILVSAVLIMLSGFNIPNEDSRKASMSYGVMLQVAPTAYNMIAKIYPGAESFSDTIKKTIDENNPLNQFSF